MPHAPMQSHLSSPWNNAVSILEMRFGEQKLSTGSCFFWAHQQRIILVTNWHNLAGRNPLSGSLLACTGAVPDRIVFRAFVEVSAADESGLSQVESRAIEVPLADEATGLLNWREHPVLGRLVDVAAIDITDKVEGFDVATVNQLESDALLEEYVSQDVFVIGFPFGLMTNAPAPVWKRGTIATDPTFNVDNLPKMLVDTATREGMSGSVVLARHTLINKRYNKRDGGMQIVPVGHAELDCVVGIYSGRHYPDHEKAQLGIVWKRAAIEHTIVGGTRPMY